MKKLFILLACFYGLITQGYSQQVSVSVVVVPPYPTKISQIASNPGMMIVTITNMTAATQRVQLRGRIEGVSNNIIVKVSDNFKSPSALELGPGEVKNFSGYDAEVFYDFTALEYIGITESQAIQIGGLPEGSYRFCVSVYDYDSNQPLSVEGMGCSNIFTVSSLEPPTLLKPVSPESNSGIDTVNCRTQGYIYPITWTPPPGTASPTIRYRLRMIEVMGNQNANDAFMNPALPLFFEQDEIVGTMYLYGAHGEQALADGRKYAVMVQAYDDVNNVPFRNNGQSEVHAFYYKCALFDDNGGIVAFSAGADPLFTPDCEDCKMDIPSGTAVAPGSITAGTEIEVGEFTMTITTSQPDGGLLSGTGTIPMPFLNFAKLNVEFSKIEIVNSNGSMKLKGGLVQGRVSSDAPNIVPDPRPSAPNLQVGEAEARDLQNYFASHVNKMVSNLGNLASFDLPIGLDQDPALVAIVNIYFDAQRAWMSAAAAVDIPDGNKVLGLSAKNVCINKNSFCKDATLYLSKDFEIPAINLTLKKPSDNSDGTSLVIDKNGFKKLSIEADYLFPAGSLVVYNTNTPIKAGLKATTTEGWNNWMAEVSLPKFNVSGMSSIAFDLGNRKMYYDHSDKENPPGIPAQFSYPGESSINTSLLTWHGFYIEQIEAFLPEIIKNTGNNGKISVIASGLLFDSNGFTGTIANSNTLLEIGKGSLDGWHASIDQVNIVFFKSGFKKSSMDGKFVLPASTRYDNKKNQLDYSANLTTANGSFDYSFVVKPKEDLIFDVLVMKVKIDSNSSIIVTSGEGNSGAYAKAELNGKVSIINDPSPSGEMTPLEGLGSLLLPDLTFNNLKFMTKSPFWDKEGFSCTFASPQKGVAGFDFTIERPDLVVDVTSTSTAEVGLKFLGKLDLIAEVMKMKADASFTLSSKITKSTDFIKWVGVGGKINEINFGVGLDFGAFKLTGAVKYYNNTRGGKVDEGFVGALETQIAELVTVNMRARFGIKSDNAGEFKYFDFNALCDFGQAGITFAPPVPLAIYGFGGGFYYNMAVTGGSIPKPSDIPVIPKTTNQNNLEKTHSSDKDPKKDADPLALLDFNPAGITLTPQRGGFGFSATILFGLTSRNTLDANATLTLGFNTETFGLKSIVISGEARILTDVSEPLSTRRDVSTGAGEIKIDINILERYFKSTLDYEMGVPNVGDPSVLHATGGGEFFYGNAPNGQNGWYLKIGTPEGTQPGPNTVTLLNLISGKSYFEVGSIIDNMPEIPKVVKDLVGYTGKDQQSKLVKPAQANRAYNPEGSNQGLILGASIQVSDWEKEYQFLMFFAKFTAYAGFDLSINPGVSCDNVKAAGGPGGWYARGQAYFGARAAVGINVDLLLVSGEFTIFEAGAAAIVTAGLPNPNFVKGVFGAYYNILNGLLEGNFHFQFAIGEECKNSASDAFGGVQIISNLIPTVQDKEKVTVDAVPGVIFNITVGGEIQDLSGYSKYISGYFQVDDFEQADEETGEPKKRYFLFNKSCLTITLNGQDVTKQMRRITGDNKTLVYYSSDHLEKDTKYNFKVVAKMIEGFNVNLGGFPHMEYNDFVRDSKTKAVAFQSEEIEFETDSGYVAIPLYWYAYTAPLHGHKASLTQEFGSDNGKIYLEAKKVITNEKFFKYPPGTTYTARIFVNGVRSGNDVGVTMATVKKAFGPAEENAKKYVHSRWTLDNVQLQNDKDYTILFIAKPPKKTSGGKITAQRELQEFGDLDITTINTIKYNLSNMTNGLGSGEFICGGFSFHTSKYKTYQEKFDAETIKEVKNLRSSAEVEIPQAVALPSSVGIISSNNLESKNLSALKSILNLSSSAKPPYKIYLGDRSVFNFPTLISYSGERFNKADLSGSTSEELFGAGYNSLYPDLPVIPIGQNYKGKILSDLEKCAKPLVPFLAEQTGLDTSQIKLEIISTKVPAAGPYLGFHLKGGGTSEYNESAITGLGGIAIPTEVPGSGGSSSNQSSSGSSSGSNSSGQSSVITSYNLGALANLPARVPSIYTLFGGPVVVYEKVKDTYLGSRGVGVPAYTSIIQKEINKKTQWGVNWGDNPKGGSTHPGVPVGGGPGNPIIWEGVSKIITTSINNGSIKNLNLGGFFQGRR